MKRRPPRPTRTDTLFPSTTLFRSSHCPPCCLSRISTCSCAREGADSSRLTGSCQQCLIHKRPGPSGGSMFPLRSHILTTAVARRHRLSRRWEERREGKECVSTCRPRGWTKHNKDKRHEENKKRSTKRQ